MERCRRKEEDLPDRRIGLFSASIHAHEDAAVEVNADRQERDHIFLVSENILARGEEGGRGGSIRLT